MLQFFKLTKPKNANITDDIDPVYLYKLTEVELLEDDEDSLIKAMKKVDKDLGDLDNIVAIEK